MNDTEKMATAEVLRKAKAVLQEKGWTQGQYQSPDGRLCATGAILFAQNGSIEGPIVGNQAYCAMADVVTDGFSVSSWNDRQESVEPILEAFDRAIALAEQA